MCLSLMALVSFVHSCNHRPFVHWDQKAFWVRSTCTCITNTRITNTFITNTRITSPPKHPPYPTPAFHQ